MRTFPDPDETPQQRERRVLIRIAVGMSVVGIAMGIVAVCGIQLMVVVGAWETPIYSWYTHIPLLGLLVAFVQIWKGLTKGYPLHFRFGCILCGFLATRSVLLAALSLLPPIVPG